MGRKANRSADAEGALMDTAAKKEAEKALSVQEVDKAYLPVGESYNLHVVMERARFYQTQAATSLIELGKQIILLKSHEPHGQFLAAIEDLGMAERSARYAMAAAQKFSNRQTTAVLGNEKIRALTVLDDDSIKTLEEGGGLAGIGTLDDIEKMTVKELKSALRAEKQKRKEEREAQEAAISQKEQKLNELEMELRYREPPTKEQLAQAKLDEKRKPLFTAIMSGIEDLSVAIDRVWDMCRTEDVQLDQLTRLARSFDSEMSLLKEKLDMLDEAFNTACPIKEDAPCTSSMPNK